MILSVGGLPVNAPGELEFRLATRGPGTEVAVAFQRDGLAETVRVALEVAPDVPKSAPRRLDGPSPLSGLVVADVNPRLIDEMDLPLDTRGVIVISPDGYAGRAGLRAGDVIARLNGETIETVDQLARMVARRAGAWALDVRREGRTLRMRIGG